METILMEPGRYADRHALHEALRRMLALPDHYGMNADALHDCLAERPQPVNVWVLGHAEGDTAKAWAACVQVFEDLGGQVKQL
ncbi:MAG: barstar family protein [Clostridia bacterium]|nr:barstar family protein [Clostridia bacterium]